MSVCMCRLFKQHFFIFLKDTQALASYPPSLLYFFFFFLNDPAPTETSPLPLHAALPIPASSAPVWTRPCQTSASSRNRSSRSGTPEAPKAASPRPASAARTSATARSCESRCTSLWYNRAVRFLVLDRYIVRELIPPFALSTALFTFFLIIDRIYHLADLAVTKGVPLHLVVQLLVFMLPSFLAHTLPMP